MPAFGTPPIHLASLFLVSVPRWLAMHQQCGQPRDPARDPVSLVLGQPLHGHLPLRLILEIEVREGLPDTVDDDKRLPILDDRPARRKTAAAQHRSTLSHLSCRTKREHSRTRVKA